VFDNLFAEGVGRKFLFQVRAGEVIWRNAPKEANLSVNKWSSLHSVSLDKLAFNLERYLAASDSYLGISSVGPHSLY